MLTRDRLGAFVAVLFGAAVVTMTLTLLASATPQRPERFAAVTVAVQSPGVTTPADPFPETRPWSSAEASGLAARLAAVTGVTAAVADRSFYAQPVRAGRPVTEIQQGRGWASAALAADRLTAGRQAAGAREVVLDEGLGVPPGGTVTVLTATGPASWTVSGLIAAPRLYVADAEAARLAPGVRVIGLTGDPDPAAIRAVAGGATVLHGDALGDLEPRADARTRWIGLQVLSAMVALSVFSCVFVIASTLALSVNQRRREIGLLRAIGATPRQVRFVVLREAATVGLVAGATGAAIGLLLTPLVGTVLVDAGFEPESFHASVHLWPVLMGVAIGPLVAVAGGLMAARRAARVRPLEALRRAAVETRPMTRARWIFGLVFAAGGAAAGTATAATDDLADLGTYALLGAMALVIAAALLAPAVVPLLVRAILRPAGGALGTVIRESALTGSRRTASTAAPVLLTVAFSVFIAGNVQTAEQAYADRRAGAARAETVLFPDRTPGLTDAAAPTADLTTSVYLTVPPPNPLNSAPPTDAAAHPVDPMQDAYLTGTVVAATGRVGSGTVLGESRAREVRVLSGGTINVTFADGERESLRVASVQPDEVVPGGLMLARETVRRHDPSALASAFPLGGGPVPAALGARAVDVATYAREAGSEEDRLVWIFTLLLVAVSVGYGALAVANTLFMATARRAGDYRLLRLAGATPRQVLLAVAGESVLVVVIGSVLGGAAALLALWGATAGLREQTGTAVALTVPWPVVAVAVGTCLILAVTGSVLPATHALRERA